MKRIRFSRHAYERLQDRGATVEEVVETIRTADWTPVASGRWSCQKDFRFESVWNGKFYAMKQVRPIFVEEPEEIVVVTVYVYYF
jgi:hypothetical protein